MIQTDHETDIDSEQNTSESDTDSSEENQNTARRDAPSRPDARRTQTSEKEGPAGMLSRLNSHLTGAWASDGSKRKQHQQTTHRPARSLLTDRRGVSSIVGGLLLVVLISSLFVAAQAQLAPALQEQTEVTHSKQVIGDMMNVQTNIYLAASTGVPGTTTVKLGSNYPTYGFLFQPPGPGGTVNTSDSLTVTIVNAKATDPETADYLDGSDISVETQSLTYSPKYNEFDNPPRATVGFGSLWLSYPRSQSNIRTSTGIVSGQNLILTTIRGDLRYESTSSTQLVVEPLSAGPTQVPVEADSGHIKYRIQTELTEEQWETILETEIDSDTNAGDATDGDERFIAEVTMDTTTNPNTAVIHLEKGVTYNLNMDKIGVRRGTQASSGSVPDTKYFTPEGVNDPSMIEESEKQLTVTVRDEYNNPVSGVTVRAIPESGSVGQEERDTDSDGQATFTYTSPEVATSVADSDGAEVEVTVKIKDTTAAAKKIDYQVTIKNAYD